MARKRIKTFAQEWGISLDEVLATCARLKLGHAHSDSSLLTPEEADRIKHDLDEQAHRQELMRRETVVETSAGKVLEKRLNATVMRRRHTEPEAGFAHAAAEPDVPFHFELEVEREEAFATPFLEERQEPAEPEIPALFETEPAAPALHETPAPHTAPAAEHPAQAPGAHAAPNGAAVKAEQPIAELPAAAELPADEAVKADKTVRTETVTAAKTEAARPERAPAPSHEQKPLTRTIVEPPRPQPPGTRGPVMPRMQPSAGSGVRRIGEVRPQAAGRTINLTGSAHAAAPSLDDGQRGPRVLGKIELPKPAPRPSAPVTRPGAPPRPGQPSRFAPAAPAPQQPDQGAMPPPGDAAAKPGARTIKKKRVVKKGAPDFTAEREMRGLRVPKKRRALPGKEQRKTEITTPKASKRVVRITEGVTVSELARNMGVKAGEIIKKLMDLGVMSTLNQVLDVDTAALVANEFGYSVENVAFDVESAIEESETEEAAGEMVARPPVVTVMGHVDHGKTSLLDAIRHAKVTEQEFGGITQHIGAYTVEANARKITFVDTPGHEAFTAMRARGAKVTDIVILVVAADEGVMPQTVEALNHARAAKVPIVVAINKIDRPEANIDRVKQQLTEQGLIPEDYGGDTIVVPVSARTGVGIDKLLEMLLLQADVLELKANPDRPARGTVVESELDRGRGPVATVLIQEGTLRQGDPFVCGVAYGRVRAMLDHNGQRVAEAPPATPVEIFGLSGVPEPGTPFVVVAEEAKARQVAEFRQSKQREGELQKSARVSLQDLSERMKAGEVKELKVIIKGDVQGSVEALADSLSRLSTAEVKIEILHSSAGAISETDVTLASASNAVILGFNIRPEPKAAALAEKEGVEVRLYTVIYEAINEMREAMEGLLAPTYREKSLGRAEVRKTFNIPGGTIAGSMVVDGKITRNGRARLVRDGRVVWEGKIGSLRRFKDDARDVSAGYECGIGLENYNDVKPDDVIEAFEMEAIARKLETPRSDAIRGHAAAEKHPQT
ncbi:MAG TPA: translation initiation factor IF-2 [Candidatus Binataceae bacterium]|nr:translation initiation factor IF-2 [Candidatus Binataceae bacterium]